ncbi:class 1 fructose-bisphosphatase [Gammaproteobacteria bacterium]|nr:class 1 fructose-bisphosphatase [Gammaproteobacteria bacterium]
MSDLLPLEDYLDHWQSDAPQRAALIHCILQIARASHALCERLRMGEIAGTLGAHGQSEHNSDGDLQKALDVYAHDLYADALALAPVAQWISEESDHPETLHPDGELLVAMDPLDGSSNVDTNVSVGTVFAIFSNNGKVGMDAFRRAGSEQLAAGYVVYGPQTLLVLTVGDGVHGFTLEGDGHFRRTHQSIKLPSTTSEFAINAANQRYWQAPIQSWFGDCLAGAEGPRGRNFNMRWVGSMCADVHRIFTRGGVFMYPADRRSGYQHGRLRLLYEVMPMAMLIEHAGGRAITGHGDALDVVAESPHQRCPVILGSAGEIDAIAGYFERG